MNCRGDCKDATATDETMARCAAYGNEDNNLKVCTACKLVKYCNRQCQLAHRPQHKKECKKRASELFHQKQELMKEPPKHFMGDCPICCLPLPGANNTAYQICCGKTICCGCLYHGGAAALLDQRTTNIDVITCPFCRAEVNPDDHDAYQECLQRRLDAKDPPAFVMVGDHYKSGTHGYPQDINKAMKSYHTAENLGSILVHCDLGCIYYKGDGVERDTKKGIHHFQRGAISGMASCRHALGCHEYLLGNMQMACKHWVIAAGAGYDQSLECLKLGYSDGHVPKDVLESALRAHKETTDELKSMSRDMVADVLMMADPTGGRYMIGF